MDDEPLPNADYYRRIAVQIVELAGKAQHPEVRVQLLELAQRFGRMAAFVERRYPERRGTRSAPDNPRGS